MPRSTRRPLALVLTFAAAGLLALAPGATAAPRARMVHLRGTAYEFNSVHTMLAGATIKVDEFPSLQATVAADGTYDLAVPDGKDVTPYIIAAGHHSIYLQTFHTDGQDLEHVNFQVPSDGIYSALAALLKVPLGPDGNPAKCVIVSTFNTKNVRGLSYADFIAYGAHGVAGATATGSPALPPAIYFNENVIPDPTQTASSKDGGVLFLNVPDGVYTVSAHHPTTRFASFTATCRAGRLINANPEWGLHQLADDVPARLTGSFRQGRTRSLRITGLPAGATVTASCTGRRCPFTTKAVPVTGTSADVKRALGARLNRLRAGQTFDLAVAARPYNTRIFRMTIGRRGAPRRSTLCIPLGETRLRRTCEQGSPGPVPGLPHR